MLNTIASIIIVYLVCGFITTARSLYCAVKYNNPDKDDLFAPEYIFYCIIFWWAYWWGVICAVYNRLKRR